VGLGVSSFWCWVVCGCVGRGVWVSGEPEYGCAMRWIRQDWWIWLGTGRRTGSWKQSWSTPETSLTASALDQASPFGVPVGSDVNPRDGSIQ
jgi:hypothetical protein